MLKNWIGHRKWMCWKCWKINIIKNIFKSGCDFNFKKLENMPTASAKSLKNYLEKRYIPMYFMNSFIDIILAFCLIIWDNTSSEHSFITCFGMIEEHSNNFEKSMCWETVKHHYCSIVSTKSEYIRKCRCLFNKCKSNAEIYLPFSLYWKYPLRNIH